MDRLQDSIELLAAAPDSVEPIAQRIGPPGSNKYFYWVVAHFPIGNTVTTAPAYVSNAPNVHSFPNAYVIVSWDNIPGASAYDVIRTNTPSFPNTSGYFAVALGVAGGPVEDYQDLLPFDPNTLNGLPWGAPVARYIYLNNRDYSEPTLELPIQVRVSTIIFSDGTKQITAGGGSGAVASVFGRTGAVVAATGDYNASQVTNAVTTLGAYTNPSWIVSLDWSKITNAPVPPPAPVTSVFGRTGAVVALAGDYTAAQVTNAVDQTSSYANPIWITSLAWGKLTGAPTLVNSFNGRVGVVVPAGGDYIASQVTNAVDATQGYANPSWITSLAYAKLTGAPAPYVLPVATTTVLGGVKQGSGVSIAADGTLSATGAVSSVFGRTGAVVAATGDYTAAQITNAVSTTSTYSDPAWITSLNWSKITSAPAFLTTAVTSLSSLTGAITLVAGANVTITPSGQNITIAASGGPASQTPWTSDINGAGYRLLNAGNVGIGNSLVVLPSTDAAVNLVVGSTNSAQFGEVTACANHTTIGNAVGAYAIANYAITGADKRIAFIASVLDGASNSGNLQFFTYNTGSMGERMRITAAGNVGLANTSPQARLDSTGMIRVTDTNPVPTTGVGLEMFYDTTTPKGYIDAYDRGTSTYKRLEIDGSPLTLCMNGGNVGIGTASPLGTLTVKTGTNLDLSISSSPVVTGVRVAASNDAGSAGIPLDLYGSVCVFMGGNVGIGTASPGAAYNGVATIATSPVLDIKSANTANATLLRLISAPSTGGSYFAGIEFDANDTATANQAYNAARIYGVFDSGAYAAARLTFSTPTGGGTWTDVMSLKNGNVGIGTQSPTGRLTINGSGLIQNQMTLGSNAGVIFALTGDTGAWGLYGGAGFDGHTWLQGGRTDGNTTAYPICLQASGGNVGIGTASPQVMLDIGGNTAGALQAGLATGPTDSGFRLYIRNGQPGGTYGTEQGALCLYYQNTAYNSGIRFLRGNSGSDGWLAFDTAGAGRLVITANGSVGIGNSAPTFPLGFAASVGDKIALYDAPGNCYGFGIQSSLLQIYSSNAGTRIGLGYGTSASFTETLSVVGGRVGIGTATPAVALAVNGDIQCGSAGTGSYYVGGSQGAWISLAVQVPGGTKNLNFSGGILLSVT